MTGLLDLHRIPHQWGVLGSVVLNAEHSIQAMTSHSQTFMALLRVMVLGEVVNLGAFVFKIHTGTGDLRFTQKEFQIEVLL